MKTTKKVLIVIDVQNDFITGCLGNEMARKALPNIVNLVKNEKYDYTYMTMDTHGEGYLTNTLEGKRLPVEHCIEGTDGWKVPDELYDAINDYQNLIHIFNKPTFGSVYMCSHLASTLTEDNVDYEFTFVGFCTDICVVSNALMLRAYFPNSTIKVIENCTEGVTPESKRNALETMKMCQIEVI